MFIKTTIATISTLLPISQLWAQSFHLGTYVAAANYSSGGYGDSNQQEMREPGKLVDLISGGGGMAYSMAEATTGVLRVSSTTEAATSKDFGAVNGYGSAFATFSDSMQIDLYQEGVTWGLLTVQLAVSGTVSSNQRSSEPDDSAWALANIRFNNSYGIVLDEYITAYHNETTTVPQGTIFDVEIPFANGSSFDFGVGLSIESNSSVLAPGSVSSLANFANTVYWGGIKSVVVDGVPLDSSEYNISSGSGIDYTKSFAPIPEPEIYAAIFGLGLAAFGILRRRTDRPTRGRAALPRGPI